MEKVYLASRYDKGEAAYLNCPMTEEEFDVFYDALITAEIAAIKEFEKEIYFEGCMPVEVIASRGKQTRAVRADEAGRTRRSRVRASFRMLLFSFVKTMQQARYIISSDSRRI